MRKPYGGSGNRKRDVQASVFKDLNCLLLEDPRRPLVGSSMQGADTASDERHAAAPETTDMEQVRGNVVTPNYLGMLLARGYHSQRGTR